MADSDPNATPPAGTPPATPPAATPPAAAAPPPTSTPPSADLAALQAKLEAAQAEAARLKPLAEQAAVLKAKAEEAEQKRMEEQGQFKELAERRAGELNKTQQRLIRAEVRAAAIQEGIIDRDLVQLLPIDDSMLVNGEPDLAKISAAVSAWKAAKPQLFQTSSGQPPAPPPRTSAGAPPPPAAPDAGGLNVKDRTKFKPEDVEREYAKFRQTLSLR